MKEEVRKLGREESIRVKQERADQFAESMRWKLAEYSGQSWNDIARGLNAAGVATATGKGKWTARSVKNVQDRIAALDKVLAEARGVKALGNALLHDGLENVDWEAMEEDWQEQMSRYAEKHGDLRGFSYEGGFVQDAPEVRREVKRGIEDCFARARSKQRDRVEALRASGADPKRLALEEAYMLYDAQVDAGLNPDRDPLTKKFRRPTDEELANLKSPWDEINAMKREWKERDRKQRHEERLAQWASKRARGGRTRKEEAERLLKAREWSGYEI